MSEVSIRGVLDAFPEFVVGFVVAEGLRQTEAPELAKLFDDARVAIGEQLRDKDLSQVPELKCWRDAYKAFGVRGTTYRCSVDRLVRRALRHDQPLAIGVPLVDAYNVVSLRHLLPVGADDLDLVQPPVEFRFARPGDRFCRLNQSGVEEPPELGEVVYADAARVLCRRWNWYQGAETAIGSGTTRAILTVQGLGASARERVSRALVDLDELLERICGSRQSSTILEVGTPEAALPRAEADAARIC